jgi:hypothetical protein
MAKLDTRVSPSRHPFLHNEMVAQPVFNRGTQTTHNLNSLNRDLLYEMSMGNYSIRSKLHCCQIATYRCPSATVENSCQLQINLTT